MKPELKSLADQQGYLRVGARRAIGTGSSGLGSGGGVSGEERITEDGETRITEDGETRVLE